jgi:hypothetical protein
VIFAELLAMAKDYMSDREEREAAGSNRWWLATVAVGLGFILSRP